MRATNQLGLDAASVFQSSGEYVQVPLAAHQLNHVEAATRSSIKQESRLDSVNRYSDYSSHKDEVRTEIKNEIMAGLKEELGLEFTNAIQI